MSEQPIARTGNGTQREKVSFSPNVPMQIALKFPDGKMVEGRFGDQMFYSLTDGRCMYLDLDVAAKINALELKRNEPFWICKRWSGKKGDPVQWDVWRVEPGEAQKIPGIPESPLEADNRRKRQVAPQSPQVSAPPPTPAPVHTPAPNRYELPEPPPSPPDPPELTATPPNGHNGNGIGGNGNGKLPPPAASLDPFDARGEMLQCYREAVDIAVEIEQYAAKKGLAVRCSYEDLRAMSATLFIDRGKNRRMSAFQRIPTAETQHTEGRAA